MSETNDRVERDRQMIVDAKSKGLFATLGTYTRLSGPGWLQSAITLGGGSLAGSMYLGVLAGYSLLWLQPLAMIMGVIMLSAIGYVALSTGERPFDAINKHVNPVLGWGWAIATLMANLVWCMPQFALGTAAVRQNLLPNVLGDGATMSSTTSMWVVILVLFFVAAIIVWSYDSGGWGVKFFEIILKIMVGMVVVCFFLVVGTITYSGVLNWGNVVGGFIPDLGLLSKPAATFDSALAATGEFRTFWEKQIVDQQRDVMVTAAATAVGINMTFLLPYSMLKRGWGPSFRGLAIFDLSTGLFIPFVLATSCVVIASATQFHATPAPGFLGEVESDGTAVEPAGNLVGGFEGNLGTWAKYALKNEDSVAFTELETLHQEHEAAKKQARSAEEAEALGPSPLDVAVKEKKNEAGISNRTLAAMLVKRDAFNLAGALEPLTGDVVAQTIFGLGVLGMAISSIIILMLINGFTVCEMLNVPGNPWVHRAGCYLAGIVGMSGPFLFQGEAKFWLAVPTSVFGMILLPIAYLTFFLMMNSRPLLGDKMPTGTSRMKWNLLMGVALALAIFGSGWSIWSRTMTVPDTNIEVRWIAIGIVSVFLLLALAVHFILPRRPAGKD